MPTLNSSAQSWYVMVTVFTLMGIGFFIQGRVKKSWLQYLHRNNVNIFSGWVTMGILDESCLRTYKLLEATIEALQEPTEMGKGPITTD